jgi:hypothetical protein
MELPNTMRKIAQQNQDEGIDLNLDMWNFEQDDAQQGQAEEK